jgi:hypothetical protein
MIPEDLKKWRPQFLSDDGLKIRCDFCSAMRFEEDLKVYGKKVSCTDPDCERQAFQEWVLKAEEAVDRAWDK